MTDTEEALHEQNENLLAEVSDLERQLDAKRREVEKLGSKVTNLEMDVQRRDAVIDRLRAESETRSRGIIDLQVENDRMRSQDPGWQALYETERERANRLEQESGRLGLQVNNLTAERNGWETRAQDHGDEVVRLRHEVGLLTAELKTMVKRDAEVSAQVPDGGGIAFTCNLPHVARRKLPDERLSHTFKIRIGTGEPTFCKACSQRIWKPGDRTEAYVHCGQYEDGSFGDIFLSLEALRNGELASVGFAMLGQIISVAVQYGVPVAKIVEKLKHQHDECAGWMMVEENGKLVAHPSIGHVNGFTDAVARIIERAAGIKPDNQGEQP